MDFARVAPALHEAVILSRVDGEGSQNASIAHFEILADAQDDGFAYATSFGSIGVIKARYTPHP